MVYKEKRSYTGPIVGAGGVIHRESEYSGKAKGRKKPLHRAPHKFGKHRSHVVKAKHAGMLRFL